MSTASCPLQHTCAACSVSLAMLWSSIDFNAGQNPKTHRGHMYCSCIAQPRMRSTSIGAIPGGGVSHAWTYMAESKCAPACELHCYVCDPRADLAQTCTRYPQALFTLVTTNTSSSSDLPIFAISRANLTTMHFGSSKFCCSWEWQLGTLSYCPKRTKLMRPTEGRHACMHGSCMPRAASAITMQWCAGIAKVVQVTDPRVSPRPACWGSGGYLTVPKQGLQAISAGVCMSHAVPCSRDQVHL
jgi:hypothetical protein